MKCEKMRSELMDVLLGDPETVNLETQEHLSRCPSCKQELASLRQTMSLLDEWTAPEPSPYFASRVRAMVREEASRESAGWLSWLRRPAVATAAAGLLALGVGLLGAGHWNSGSKVAVADNPSVHLSAVTDLQYLDRNADLFADFDALDGQSQTE